MSQGEYGRMIRPEGRRMSVERENEERQGGVGRATGSTSDPPRAPLSRSTPDSLRLTPVGDAALLAEFTAADLLAANRRMRALYRALAAQPPRGLLDLVPAYQTLLVVFDPLVLAPAAAAVAVELAATVVD